MGNRRFFPCGAWVEENESTQRIGLTKKAVRLLGEVSYVQLPSLSTYLERDQVAVVLETGKAALDIEAPMSGAVVAINDRVVQDPDLLNQDPEGGGWLYELGSDAITPLAC